jgi:predicted DNA-binding transcriptional regulator AlpA
MVDSSTSRPITPRLIRLRDAPQYLGMDKNRFNREVRPYVELIRIGTQGIAFDRIDLDAWVDDHKSRNGRPTAKRSKPWDEVSNDGCQDSSFGAESGTSTKSYTARAFAKALAQAISKKPKRS